MVLVKVLLTSPRGVPDSAFNLGMVTYPSRKACFHEATLLLALTTAVC